MKLVFLVVEKRSRNISSVVSAWDDEAKAIASCKDLNRCRDDLFSEFEVISVRLQEVKE